MQERRNTYDVDFQHQSSPFEGHHFISGVNYRNSQDDIGESFTIRFEPDSFTTEWVSVYTQDTMTLVEDRWHFTLGCRAERDTRLADFRAEPTARLLFLPTERQSMWASVSRSARNPTRLDQHFVSILGTDPNNPDFLALTGSTNTVPENVVSYELGLSCCTDGHFHLGHCRLYQRVQRSVQCDTGYALCNARMERSRRWFLEMRTAHPYGLKQPLQGGMREDLANDRLVQCF